MYEPIETAELQVFVAVVDTGSVSGAARELGLPRATVSRRLARLEDRLSVRLLRRTTRQSALTDAGEELYAHARIALAAVRDAEAAIRRADGRPRGLLRVSMPPGNPAMHDAIVAFMLAFPEVQLDIDWTSRHVDLIAEGYDVALRATSALDPGLIARRLLHTSMRVVASPGWVAAAGPLDAPDDLARHGCLVGFARGERPVTHWPLVDGGVVRVRARLASNAVDLLARAAVAGLGPALLPVRFVADGLADGSLVGLLPQIGQRTELALVYPEREFLPPAVRAFVDFVGAELLTRLPA